MKNLQENPAETELRVKAEQLEILFSSSAPVSIAHILTAMMMAFLLSDQQEMNHILLFSLTGSLVSVALARVGLFYFYRRAKPALQRVSHWSNYFFYGSVSIGFVWSLVGILLLPNADVQHQLIIGLILVSITSLATLTLSADRKCYLTFIFMLLLPLGAVMFMESYHDAIALAFLLVLLLTGFLIGAERNHRNIVQNIKLRIEGDEREEILHSSEGKLKRSEERFSLAMSAANDGLWDWNLLTNEVYFSPRWKSMLGYEQHDLKNVVQTWIKLMNPDERVEVLNKVEQYKAGFAVSFELEYRMRHKDGHWLHILSKSLLVREEDSGKPIRLVGTHTDITEKKILENQFRQSQKMEALGTLVGGIAHDFNNMLAAVVGNTYLAKKSSDNPEKLLKHLNTIDQISSRASGMIKQLLSFSRKGELEMKVLPLKELISESFELAYQAMPASIDYTCKVCDEDLYIVGDVSTIQQALMNLFNNARDAVEGVPKASVTCSLSLFEATELFKRDHPDLTAKEFARISVKDNGAGIAADQLSKVFEPFYTTKAVDKGTGLGLSMVFGAVKNHGGAIEVDSVLGKGTVFHIYLPTVKAQGSFEESGKIVVTGRGELILLVDDNEQLREVTEETLVVLGYKVLTAVDGKNALEIYEQYGKEINLVITDVVMPKLGGLDLFRKLRSSGSKVPVIFQTGYEETIPTLSEKLFEDSPVVHKPFSIEVLSQVVKRMIVGDK